MLKHFAEFPEFIDVRHVSFSKMCSNIDAIETFEGSLTEIIVLIDSLHIVAANSEYSRDVSSISQLPYQNERIMSMMRFNRYKQIMGEDNFV